MDQSPFIITGMHRSGTSLIARFMHFSGMDLGERLLGANPSNPYGHFEDLDILDFHKSILLREFNHSMWVTALPHYTSSDLEQARELFAPRPHKVFWGWKEPRTSLFLGLWEQVFPHANYLFIIRHPRLVLDSLKRRTRAKWYHFWQYNRYLANWLLYNQACYQFWQTHRENGLLIKLDAILSQPDRFVSCLQNRLAYSFEVVNFGKVYDERVLNLKRPSPILMSPFLYKRCVEFYDILCEEADL
ncbi:MAG: sulfotransferase [Anaerolineales bacterium]|nr:sulfotransferase [Anaerolineales bacterium]MCB8989452.1 sulfotransferase [Ardenticatenaceae bacterium]MCB9005010.1 sulfotransferase [Ardenticatenaceae bacterium]